MNNPRGKAIVSAAVLLTVLLSIEAGPPAKAQTAQPNIVIILTDDQRWDTLRRMPQLQDLLVDRGVRYSNAMVPTSLCCPSRASLLRGQYAHSTGVWSNGPPTGGWYSFEANGGEQSNLATWLDNAGYRTGLIGKYLNGYENDAPAGHVPPGWDHWVAFDEPGYYDYDLVRNGTIEHHGERAADYSTDVIADEADAFIRSADPDEPLFAYVAPYGMHTPFIAPPRDEGSCDSLPAYRPPSYNRLPQNAPRWLAYPAWDFARRRQVDTSRRRACAIIGSLDDLVAQTIDALADTGRLSQTLVVFASDNGYMWGEHRATGKGQPYDAATRIPMVARMDGVIGRHMVDGRLALNIDIASTIEDVTGLSFPGLAGQSLLNPSTRSGFVLEATSGGESTSNRPAYCGWRQRDRVYVRYGDGSAEFYNLATDPFETNNKISAPAAQPRIRRMRLAARSACDPMPPGFVWSR